MVYSPWSEVETFRSRPVSVCTTRTCAPGIDKPDESWTVPLICAVETA